MQIHYRIHFYWLMRWKMSALHLMAFQILVGVLGSESAQRQDLGGPGAHWVMLLSANGKSWRRLFKASLNNRRLLIVNPEGSPSQRNWFRCFAEIFICPACLCLAGMKTQHVNSSAKFQVKAYDRTEILSQNLSNVRLLGCFVRRESLDLHYNLLSQLWTQPEWKLQPCHKNSSIVQ